MGAGDQAWLILCLNRFSNNVMTTPTFNYDELSDPLHVSFAPGEEATGIESNDSCYAATTPPAPSP